MKHILHTKENSVKPSFWAFHDEAFIQAPIKNDYAVGDVVIISPEGALSNIKITSKREITLRYPLAAEIYDFDSIAMIVTSLSKCFLNNKCHTPKSKRDFIAKHYQKIADNVWGKKNFIIGEKGFMYGYTTSYKNALNPACDWTRIETKDANFTTTCKNSFKEIGDFKYCPSCGGEIEERPLFHIDVTDRYTQLLQQIKDDLYKKESDIHRFTDTLFFIDKMAGNFSEKLGYTKADILEAFEKRRVSWSANYYQKSSIPFLTDSSEIYETIEDFRKNIDAEKGFRCGSCGKISTGDNAEIECSECHYKIYGFLTVGNHYEFVVRDEFLEKPFVYKILTPVSLEVGQ